MFQKKTPITTEGLQKLQEELTQLKTVRRHEVARAIQTAKEQGDLSENAEYVDAKEEQGMVEQRIVELEAILKNSEIIHKDANNNVSVGDTVTVDIEGRSFTYTIVGPNEADPRQGTISNESPLGIALQGKKAGETFTMRAPSGSKQVKVVKVS